MKTGDYVLNYEKCNIVALVEETVYELESMLKEKNVTILVRKDGETFDTECDRMQKALKIIIIYSASFYL